MEKKGRKRGHILAGALTAVLAVMLAAAPVSAKEEKETLRGTGNEPGSIRIILKDLGAETSSREGVEFGLWKVGTVNEYGTPVFDERYGLKGYPQDSQSLDEAAKKISDALSSAAKGPDRTETTDQGGCLLFDQVERGVYLLRAGEDNPYGEISPFLVQLPYWEKIEGQMEGPVYEVEAEPKASPHPVESETTDPGKTAAKTGDETSAAGYLLVLTAAVLALITIAVLKRKELKKEKEEGERGNGR